MVLDRVVVGAGTSAEDARVVRWAEEEFGGACRVSRVPLPEVGAPRSAGAWTLAWTGLMGHAPPAEEVFAADHLAGEAFAAGADLVVVGALPEPVVERLVRVSPVPVLVAGSAALRPVRRLLAAVDGTPGAAHVLPWARELRDRLRAVVVPCHVMPELSYTELRHAAWRSLAGQDDVSCAEAARRAWLRDALRAEGLGEAEPLVRLAQGDPESALADEASACGADLVVVGSRAPERGEDSAGAVRRRLLASGAAPVLVAAGAHWAPRPPADARAAAPLAVQV
jgi:nucleotide-binding universal stress UspA family protein